MPEPDGRDGGEAAADPSARRGLGGAAAVAAGILLSRLAGLVRDRALAHFFGVGPHADVLRAALRAPNFLQNLLGEGTLSAAFVPIYSRMLHEGREREGGRFAGAVLGLLAAAAAAAVVVGILFARPLVAILVPGYVDDAAAVAAGRLAVDRYALAVAAVRIVFPMTGVLVLSAWALGVLNSHRRFLLPYVAPVAWNLAIIAALVLAAGALPGAGAGLPVPALNRLLFAACLGALAGGVLQLLVQLPAVARLLTGFRLSLSTRVPGVKEALAAFGPAVAGRGVVQLAGYLDVFLASFLVPGAVAALGFAQTLYLLPISLFGMSVAAAELPDLARMSGGGVSGGGGGEAALAQRVRRSLSQMALLTVPTLLGYLAFGFLIVGALYRSGRFRAEATWLVYLTLGAYTLGLLANTSSRLLQNTFYALGDTRTPARTAALRVALSAAAGAALMFWLDRFAVAGLPWVNLPGGSLRLGVVGLALASAAGAWLELARLRRALAGRLPGFALPWPAVNRMAVLAVGAAAPAALLWWLLPPLHPIPRALLVVGTYGALYLLTAWRLGLPEMESLLGRLARRRG